MEKLFRKIEKALALNRRGRSKMPFVERVRECRERILKVNEERYQIASDSSLSFEERLDKVILAALETGERMMGVKGEGDHFSRIYRLRQFCWDRIFLPTIDDLKIMTPIERSVKDMEAGEAWYIGRHQELVDFCLYFSVPLPTEEAALHNKIEYVQNLWDFANRTMGGAYFDRVSIFPRKVIIQAAPVINLSERLPHYHENKKAAIAQALLDLEKAYLDCIKEANRMEIG